MKQGQASLRFENPVYIAAAASVAGKKEGEGPLGHTFTEIDEDPMLGQDNWEAAESELQRRAAGLAMEDGGIGREKIRYLFAGDLLGQLIATSFGVMGYGIPMFGLYGACSTMGESMSLAAAMVDAGNADYAMAMASSHFASAEKQFRFPLAYGNQRPYSATWTVTGCGAVIVGTSGDYARITGVTTGRIVDYGIKDSMNMGAAMAPAAADTIQQNLADFQISPSYYDKIITGDLGTVGQKLVIELLAEKGVDIADLHMDCGIEIFDPKTQDTHAGGSGCGCSAVTLCGMILKKLRDGEWKRVLFVPTGALLSSTSFNEGQSVPGIAHGVMLETVCQ